MDALPPDAVLYAPVLRAQVASYWPDMPLPASLAAQVEQETCVSLRSKGCWNPHTELKTSREYGFGLGQLTVTSRFNAFDEVKSLDPSLRSWTWDDRYDPTYQLRALVLKDKQGYKQVTGAATELDKLAFSFAAYNGGMGGVLSDRRVCAATRGCDPNKWFGNVANTSLKSKTAVAGYGQSFFEINRGYVVNIMTVRLLKYNNIMNVRP